MTASETWVFTMTPKRNARSSNGRIQPHRRITLYNMKIKMGSFPNIKGIGG